MPEFGDFDSHKQARLQFGVGDLAIRDRTLTLQGPLKVCTTVISSSWA